jgi:hypothetical protein
MTIGRNDTRIGHAPGERGWDRHRTCTISWYGAPLQIRSALSGTCAPVRLVPRLSSSQTSATTPLRPRSCPPRIGSIAVATKRTNVDGYLATISRTFCRTVDWS